MPFWCFSQYCNFILIRIINSIVPSIFIVLFCLFIVITEFFSIRLSVAIENRTVILNFNFKFTCDAQFMGENLVQAMEFD